LKRQYIIIVYNGLAGDLKGERCFIKDYVVGSGEGLESDGAGEQNRSN
jgi:hypothetical protein